jgi:hypothetical protein
MVSCSFAGLNASSINSAADAGLHNKDKVPNTDDKTNDKIKLYDTALSQYVCNFCSFVFLGAIYLKSII